jgi:hypothetical protein
MGSIRIDKGSAGEDVLKKVLEEYSQKGKLKENDKTWLPADGSETMDERMKAHLNFFSDHIKSFNMKTPLMNELKTQAFKRNLTARELKQILYTLTLRGDIYRIKDDYIHAVVVDRCREKLVNELSRREGGITVAEFRDLVGGNRKICLLLLAQYDLEMLTLRDGDFRYLQ